jgi:hypothetical protein
MSDKSVNNLYLNLVGTSNSIIMYISQATYFVDNMTKLIIVVLC